MAEGDNPPCSSSVLDVRQAGLSDGERRRLVSSSTWTWCTLSSSQQAEELESCAGGCPAVILCWMERCRSEPAERVAVV